MSETIIVGLFTLVGTLSGALITAWIGMRQTELSEDIAVREEQRQRRIKCYEDLISVLDRTIRTKNGFVDVETQREAILYFDSNAGRISLSASKHVTKLCEQFVVIRNSISAEEIESSTELRRARSELIVAMRAELGATD